ncbi:PAS domain-containing protein [Azohydromonas lata]|uniref:histidine kinase n=1 Tax=Azohydromonas lata TaxID=45677 RepID=A0ABU5I9P4_9BURK|nr:PAS domain-containing protein [Azohydromonas lata]MDZ5455824.1 PAS domain-containing protein [Azohydromonas lata]
MTEQAFRQLAELLPDALLLVDGQGIVRCANAPAAALLQQPITALAGQPLAAVVHDSEAHLAELIHQGARSRSRVPGVLHPTSGTAACRCELAVFRPRSAEQAALVLVRLVPRPVANSQFRELNARIEALSHEVARRKAAEAQLQAYSERLRVTLTSIGDGMIATDAQGRVTMMNGVAQALTGWNEADALGQPLVQVFVIVNQDTREPVANPVERVLDEGRIVGLANHTVLIARDGSERPIDDSGAPIRDAEGLLIGAVLVFRDISERYAMERELRDHAQRLMEADRRKDEFLSMLAHELRNPLAPLHNGVHLLLSRHLPAEEQRRVVTMLQRQLGHITRLVDDLLDVARLTRGRIALQRQPVSLAQVVQQAVEASRPAIDARDHELQVQRVAPELMVDGDPARLVQVFTNLLVNAAKFTPPKGLIELDCSHDDKQLCLTVRDNGMGMDAALSARVFDLFVQADQSLDRSMGGLGIGLTVVRALVEMHGGSVQAQSAGPGQGSEFVVRLPRLPAANTPLSARAAADLSQPPGASTAQRILIVDDNVDAGETLGAVLEQWGHETCLVTGAQAALDAWPAFRPHAVLLDIGLPEMSGYELARRFRASPEAAGMLLVAVTGYGRTPDRQASLDAGIDEHLTKPVDMERLRALLDRPSGATANKL